MAISIAFLLFFSAGIVRFVNFPERVNFGPEQSISLALSSDYLKGNWSLLGMPNLQRSTNSGLSLFSGSLFNYSLVPLIVLFGHDPVPITAVFAFINILTGLLIYVLVAKMTNQTIGLFSAAVFLFNDLMISHSMFIWILNYLPALGMLTVFLLFTFWSKRTSKVLPFLLGLLSGVGFNLEYFYLFTALIVFIVVIFRSKNRFISVTLFIIAAALANLPMILFDLRHDYYHVRTLVAYLTQTIGSLGQNKISYYHFLQYWPLASIVVGVILGKIYKRFSLIAITIFGIYIISNLTSQRVSFNEALGMGDNTRSVALKDLKKTSQIIVSDNPKNFNVVFFPGVDYRGYSLRYFLEYLYNLRVNGVEGYPDSETLYVFATNDFGYHRDNPWEISSFHAQNQEVLAEINPKYSLFKLTK